MSYETDFIKANHRRNLIGLEPLEIESSNSRFLDGNEADYMSIALANVTNKYTTEHVSGQCLSVHLELLDHVRNYFKSPAYYTIGYFSINGIPAYNFNEEDLRIWYLNGIPNYPRLDIHAWITLPTGEILDFTLPTTLGVAQNEPKLIGGVISKHYSELTNSLSYSPMILGEDSLIAIGAGRWYFDSN